MNIGLRIKLLREKLDLTQALFAQSIGLKQAAIGLYENGHRNISDRVISDICREFNVSEDWLKYGKGNMFVEPDTFSLDEYAKQNNLTSLELDIIKAYMSLDSATRDNIMSHLKAAFESHPEIAATSDEDSIDEKVEKYRLELEAEQKGKILSVSPDLKEAKWCTKELNCSFVHSEIIYY